MLFSTKSKCHKSNVRISWMYRYVFYGFKMHFWWPNKCFISRISSWNTLYMQLKISSKEVSTIILYSRGVVCIFTKLWTAASTFIRLPAILMSLTVIPFCRGEYSALICPMSFSIGTLPLLTLQLRASLLSLLLATASLKGTIRKSKSVWKEFIKMWFTFK